MHVKLTPSTFLDLSTSGVPVESERVFFPSSVVVGFHVPCAVGVFVVKVGVDVGIVEGIFVAVVVGAVDGGHPIFPPPAPVNIIPVLLDPTSQHNWWLNELAL